MAEYVTTHSLMLALWVAAGYGIGLSSAARADPPAGGIRIFRPLDEESAVLTTCCTRGHFIRSRCATSSTAQRVGHMTLDTQRPHEVVAGGADNSIWSKRQDLFCHGRNCLLRSAGTSYSAPCLRLRLAFCDEMRMHIVTRHSKDAQRKSACDMRIGPDAC